MDEGAVQVLPLLHLRGDVGSGLPPRSRGAPGTGSSAQHPHPMGTDCIAPCADPRSPRLSGVCAQPAPGKTEPFSLQGL